MLFRKPADTPKKHWISGLFIFCVSITLFISATIVVKNKLEFIHNASRANGKVIRQNAGKHHVEIRFVVPSGDIVEYAQNGLVSYDVNDDVTVLYDLNNPKLRPSTDAFGALWGISLVLVIVGIFVFLLAMLTIFRPRYVHITGDE